MESETAYFQRRAREERLAALKADNPNVRLVHNDLAARYEDLVRSIGEPAQPDHAKVWF